ncbi:unnamed protein product [Kuraishia capsulata CBS 1993]|uniref:Protein-lysine N-methyltransferase EFM6 n=1 Tax=Kuraishia capsulata CBS 1993 TaxID=1382522 RepID=W6MRV2_9ASCO|nr:uncharacterized protein KUCA_T00005432001 [Kuraishia capsulata CBS 1993]CDK29444.1 unnamed protein product [Kuraishia capsulata CBS 1993]
MTATVAPEPVDNVIIRSIEPVVDYGFFQMDEDLFPIRAPHKSLSGEISLDMSNLEQYLGGKKLEIYEDGGRVGCGGVLWISGHLLALYLLQKWNFILEDLRKNHGVAQVHKVVEIGSGTGVVGIALGAATVDHKDQYPEDFKVYISDIDELVPIMQKSISLNKLDEVVEAISLPWGEPLPQSCSSKVDLILAADCVYNEKAFDILEQTLVDLSNGTKINEDGSKRDTVIYMASRKRRKADLKFFRKCKKSFHMQEIVHYEGYEFFRLQNVHLWKMVLKR